MNHIFPPAKRVATYDDILAAPPNMVAEIADGELWLHPRPASRHARAGLKLGARLDDPFENGIGGPGGWYLAAEPELHIGSDILAPDLAGWRRTRMAAFPDAPWIDLAPDWVCEILSPSTRKFDTTRKRDLYGAHGVTHLWHVDPGAGTLEAFERRNHAWTLIAAVKEGDDVRIAPFDAIAFPLSALWPE